MTKVVSFNTGTASTKYGINQTNVDYSLVVKENKNILVLLPIKLTKIKIGNNSRIKFEQ